MNRPTADHRAAVAAEPHRVSSYTGGSGNCVGIAAAAGFVGIHDTKAGRRAELVVPQQAFADLIDAVATGSITRP